MVIEIEKIEIPITKLLERLGLGEIELEGIISSISFDLNDGKKNGTLKMNCQEDIDSETLDIVCEALNAYFKCDLKVSLTNAQLSPARETVLRWKKILGIMNGSFSYMTDAVYIRADGDDRVCCHVPNAFVLNKVKKNKTLLSEAIEQVIHEKVDIMFFLDDDEKSDEESSYTPQIEIEEIPIQPVPYPKTTKKTAEQVKFSDSPTPIYQMVFNKSTFTIEGEVFSFEYRNNSGVATLGLYDGTDSVKCIAFRDSAKWLSEHVENGKRIMAAGKATLDNRTQKPSFFIDQAKLMEQKEESTDDAPEKRIELHAHTQMSAMDSIMKIDDYIETAAKWGWESLAVTDHGVVQAFPDLYEKCIKKGIKPIFGMEGYLVDVTPICYNKSLLDPLDFKQKDAQDWQYVVFDFETTGLSPLNDTIIEFGAVKIRAGEVVDTFSSLVYPKREISSKITDITGITNDMLKGKPVIEEVLPDFL